MYIVMNHTKNISVHHEKDVAVISAQFWAKRLNKRIDVVLSDMDSYLERRVLPESSFICSCLPE